MAHIGEKLGFCAICRLRTECRLAQLAVLANEFVQHLVERAGQTMQLLRHVLRKMRCANAEIALGDRPGCGLDSLERARDISCEAPTYDRRRQQTEKGDGHSCRADLFSL